MTRTFTRVFGIAFALVVFCATSLSAGGTPVAGHYSVKFYPNGGKGKMAVQTFAYGKSAKLRKNTFKRGGWTFRGWAKSIARAKKGKIAYANQKAVKNLVKNGRTVKLYAVWSPVLTVKLNPNGGKVAKRKLKVKTYFSSLGGFYLDTAWTNKRAYTPTRKGYYHYGWYTKKKGGTPMWNLKIKKPTTKTLYARWVREDTDSDVSEDTSGDSSGDYVDDCSDGYGYSSGSYSYSSSFGNGTEMKIIEFYHAGKVWRTEKYAVGEPFGELPPGPNSYPGAEDYSFVGWKYTSENGSPILVHSNTIVDDSIPYRLDSYGFAGWTVGGRGTGR